ncbi:MAG: BatD family protein [Pseudomonadales bacterium]
MRGAVLSLLLVLTATWACAARATLTTYLEPRILDEMDTVRLTIRADGSAQSESPDFTPLEEDFEILGNQTSSRISSINGRTTASVEYQLNLRPKHTGEITVPSLVIGSERTEPIRVVVRPMDPSIKDQISKMVFFETELSANPVYVQAETVLTRRLFYSQGVQIYSDLPGVPEVANAVVIPLGETQSRSVLRDGQRYGVIEQRFAIFPEQSGDLTVPAISVTSSVRIQTGGRTRRSGIRVSTDPIELQVRPIPASYPADAPWLPATDVQVTQHWTPDASTVDVGDPLAFEITVEATGNRGSAIPPTPLPLPDDRFKVYPEAPVVDESPRGATVTGTRTEHYALIPTKPGPVTVPPITITWWDTAADRLRHASVDVPSLNVVGAPTPVAPDVEPPVEPNVTPQAAPIEPVRSHPGAWVWPVAVALLVLIGVSALYRLYRRYGDRLPKPPGLDLSAGRERRQCWRALKRATGTADPSRYRQALAAYLAATGDRSPAAALAAFRNEPGAAASMRALDRAIYAPQTQAPPDMAAITQLARDLSRRRRSGTQDEELPALYG